METGEQLAGGGRMTFLELVRAGQPGGARLVWGQENPMAQVDQATSTVRMACNDELHVNRGDAQLLFQTGFANQ